MVKSPFKQPWHFDKFKEDKEGEYSKCIGHFVGDWTEDIITVREMGDMPQTDNDFLGDFDSPQLAKQRLAYQRNRMKDIVLHNNNWISMLPVFENMISTLQFNREQKLAYRFNDLYPNDQLMWHIDHYRGKGELNKSTLDDPNFKYKPSDRIRFLIMLEDWEPGQILQFGNKIYTQWRAGMVMCWEWSTLPHCVWNGSWKQRPALQITGSMTDKTIEIIKEGNSETIYNV
tara:strand:+ start:5529 stop:6218 length:690 start_codon:yes stop_codon:yes gene_type:complete